MISGTEDLVARAISDPVFTGSLRACIEEAGRVDVAAMAVLVGALASTPEQLGRMVPRATAANKPTLTTLTATTITTTTTLTSAACTTTTTLTTTTTTTVTTTTGRPEPQPVPEPAPGGP